MGTGGIGYVHRNCKSRCSVFVSIQLEKLSVLVLKMSTRWVCESSPEIVRTYPCISWADIRKLLQLDVGLEMRRKIRTYYLVPAPNVASVETFSPVPHINTQYTNDNSTLHTAIWRFSTIGSSVGLGSTCGFTTDSFQGGARGSAAGWGTMLQVGRSPVRFPMTSLNFSIHLILPASLWPWGRLGL
jgi:hypothetical protein